MALLPKVTVEEVLEWDPCHGEERTRELAEPLGSEFTALDVLRAEHISCEDRMWTVLRAEMLPEAVMHEFACQAAEWALVMVGLSGAEIDERSVRAIEVKRRWIRGEATSDELDAARSAADAARSAADAAWSAAWSAADAAWSAARSAAWSAARSAAWSAADAADAADAAWSAARSAADEDLVDLLIAVITNVDEPC